MDEDRARYLENLKELNREQFKKMCAMALVAAALMVGVAAMLAAIWLYANARALTH